MGKRVVWGRLGRRRRLRRVAREVFGWPDLRPGQGEAMEHLLRGRDVLLVMPTGGGKSAVYQVPAQLLPGPTVVISPLIALQRDQMVALAGRDAGGAVMVNSAQSDGASEDAMDQIRAGRAEYIFLSPEQLAKPSVVERLAAVRPSLVAVDEAHCVSSWGHDFRPDYQRLGRVIERLGHPPVIALTATASPPVRDDILATLGLGEARQIVRGFDRPNLSLEVRRFHEEADKRRALVEDAAGRKGLGLVYVATRRDAEAYGEELAAAGLRAAAYHAGMKAADRHRVHEAFQGDELDVVVATSAFGMGIDKPDVRYVLHAAPPESPESYYQEIGRAGRDGEPAAAVLFYRSQDLGLRRFFAAGKPDEEKMLQTATLLQAHGGTVPASEMRTTLGVGASKLTSLVNLLEQAGAVETTGRGDLRYVQEGPPPEEAVARATELDENRRRVDDSRIDMMRAYAETTDCRRRFLLEYLGEPYPGPCGHCDVCQTGTAASPDHADETAAPPDHADGAPFPLHAEVQHAAWGTGTVMRVEPDRITVLFEEAGYRTLSLEAIQRDNDLLTLHPDAARPPARRGRGPRIRRDKAAAASKKTTTGVS
ncbi:RecQ family ATP-dependent DNA helicase [Actinomadura citrea]|uniref:RecQ family ATP-dependent DNA helicase n=1 Tax=Actinomadura citrea TaxID=46158 RepID=UPI002E2841E1|nr:ATP-dependent DNA helicase RecQ [Actinomadura citrea]